MRRVTLALIVSVAVTASLSAQTEITLPKNRYKPEDDVKLGKEAAAEVRQQYPVITDASIAKYLAQLGDRLVDAAPQALRQPVYQYSFTPVNLKEINAFALPGGPIATPLVNTSPLGGREVIGVYTTFLVDGTSFYYLTVVPESDAAQFNDAFQRIGESIRLTDAR